MIFVTTAVSCSCMAASSSGAAVLRPTCTDADTVDLSRSSTTCGCTCRITPTSTCPSALSLTIAPGGAVFVSNRFRNISDRDASTSRDARNVASR